MSDTGEFFSASEPAVSVIVVNWDRREMLRECLQSLAGQRALSFDVILVDNGSTDGSAEMAEREFGSLFPLRVIRNRENRGFCAANNQGIAASRARYVALLNNDAVAEQGWLAVLHDALEARPDFGMAASKILVYEDPTRIDKAGHLIYPDGQNRGRGSGEIDRGQFDRVEEVLWPDGCAAMYRRSMLDRIGGFDEELFAYGDDAELGLRARIAGWRCIYVPGAVVRHRRGATLGLFSPRRLQLIERNRVLLAVKHFPPSLLWLNGIFYGLRLAAGLWAALRGRGEAGRLSTATSKGAIARALVAGNLEALTMVPSMLRKRRAFRPLRKLSSREVRALLRQYRIPLKTLSEQAV